MMIGPRNISLIQAISEKLLMLKSEVPNVEQDAIIQLHRLEKFLPHGSGVDSGTTIDFSSSPEKVYLDFGYHHMDSNGFYCGWSMWRAEITPLFEGFRVDVHCVEKEGVDFEEVDELTGSTYQNCESVIEGTADYLTDLFYLALNQVIEVYFDTEERMNVYKLPNPNKTDSK